MFPKYVSSWKLKKWGRSVDYSTLIPNTTFLVLMPGYGDLSFQMNMQCFPLEGGIRPWRAAASLLRNFLVTSCSSLAAWSRNSMRPGSPLLKKQMSSCYLKEKILHLQEKEEPHCEPCSKKGSLDIRPDSPFLLRAVLCILRYFAASLACSY